MQNDNPYLPQKLRASREFKRDIWWKLHRIRTQVILSSGIAGIGSMILIWCAAKVPLFQESPHIFAVPFAFGVYYWQKYKILNPIIRIQKEDLSD